MAGGEVVSAALILGIAAVTGSVLFGEHGLQHLLRLRGERRELGQVAFALLQDKAHLLEEIRRLRSDDLYLEQMARRQLGLVKPNELVYRFRRSR